MGWILVMVRKSWFNDLILIDDEYWFPSATESLLCRMKKDGTNFKVECELSSDCDKKRWYSRIFSYKENLIMIPGLGKEISIYNRKTKTQELITLPKWYTDLNLVHFSTGQLYNNFLYMISSLSPIVGVLNLSFLDENTVKPDFEFIEIKELYDEHNAWGVFFGQDSVILNKKIYFLYKNSSCVIEFDIENCQYEIYHQEIVFSSILLYNGYEILLIDEIGGAIYKYDILHHNSQLLFQNDNLISPFGSSIVRSLANGRWIYIWQNYSDGIQIIDWESGVITYCHLKTCKENDLYRPGRIWSKTFSWKVIGDEVIFLSLVSNKLYFFHAGKLWKEQSLFSEKAIELMNKHAAKIHAGLYAEKGYYKLNDWVKNVYQFKNNKYSLDNMVGKRIYEKMRNDL